MGMVAKSAFLPHLSKPDSEAGSFANDEKVTSGAALGVFTRLLNPVMRFLLGLRKIVSY